MAREKKMECALLGLISHRAMTGYEIKKVMDASLRHFWGASYGSIYPTLEGLVRQGLATRHSSMENGRKKARYTITAQGRQRLCAWLEQPAERDELRYETLLKVFLGGERNAGVTREHIARFAEKAKEELPGLRQSVATLEEIKGDAAAHLHYLLAARFGVMVYETYLAWCREAEELLAAAPNAAE